MPRQRQSLSFVSKRRTISVRVQSVGRRMSSNITRYAAGAGVWFKVKKCWIGIHKPAKAGLIGCSLLWLI